jgi:hypothetical protein
LTDILNYQLDQKNGDGKLRREMIAGKLIELAEGGDIAAKKYIMDRVDGRPTENIELTDGAVDARLREIMNGG